MLRLPSALVVACLLAGCGQTGPLYFDEAPPADQLPPSRQAAGVMPAPPPGVVDAPQAKESGDEPAPSPAADTPDTTNP